MSGYVWVSVSMCVRVCVSVTPYLGRDAGSFSRGHSLATGMMVLATVVVVVSVNVTVAVVVNVIVTVTATVVVYDRWCSQGGLVSPALLPAQHLASPYHSWINARGAGAGIVVVVGGGGVDFVVDGGVVDDPDGVVVKGCVDLPRR